MHTFLTFLRRRRIALLLLSGLLLAGCSLAAPDGATPAPAPALTSTVTPAPASPTAASTATATSLPTFTPSPTASPAPTASPTPTASPSPTASPAPAAVETPVAGQPLPQQLMAAQTSMKNGDFVSAVAGFRNFATVHSDDPLAHWARFNEAQALLAAGQPNQAREILEALAQEEKALASYPEILYWLGRVQQAAGDNEAAARSFERYAAQSPALKAEALLAAGDAYENANQTDKAIASYTQALAAAPNLRTTLRVREKWASAAIAANDPLQASEQYRAILEQAKSPAYRAEIYFSLGQAQLLLDQPDVAWQSFRQAIQEDRSSWYAYQALIALVKAEQSVDMRLRGEVDLYAGAYQPAIDALTEFLNTHPDDHPDEIHALIARAYEGMKDYESSAQAWQTALQAHPSDAIRNQAWMGLGRSYWRRSLYDQAREAYLSAAELVDDPDTAASALWWAATLAGNDSEKWRLAADDFGRLARDYPSSEYAAQAGFRAGLIYYRLGDYDAARQIWTVHAAAGQDVWHGAAHFWLGKLLRRQGKEADALAHWQKTAQRWDESFFYGVRAREMLRQAGLAAPDRPIPAESGGLAQARRWTARLAKQETTVFEQTPRAFGRISELHRVGEDNIARQEVIALRQKWKDDPVRLLQLSLFARDLGFYDVSIRAAARLLALSKQSALAAPRMIQTLIYPRYYDDLITSYAQMYDVDPALFFALIRQESMFWAKAGSSAGAMGLGQIIPDTAQGAASQLRLEGFSVMDLLRPQVNVMLSAYIFGQEIERGHGSVFWALAAYNAGPGNAAYWREMAEDDDDLFAELISIKETQHYVRTITVQANAYRRLYPRLRR